MKMKHHLKQNAGSGGLRDPRSGRPSAAGCTAWEGVQNSLGNAGRHESPPTPPEISRFFRPASERARFAAHCKRDAQRSWSDRDGTYLRMEPGKQTDVPQKSQKVIVTKWKMQPGPVL